MQERGAEHEGAVARADVEKRVAAAHADGVKDRRERRDAELAVDELVVRAVRDVAAVAGDGGPRGLAPRVPGRRPLVPQHAGQRRAHRRDLRCRALRRDLAGQRGGAHRDWRCAHYGWHRAH